MKHKNLLASLILAFLTALLLPPALTMETPQWNLQITNLTETTTNMTYEDLLALPKITVYANLACYGNPVASGDWQGALLSDILNQAGIDPSVLSIDFEAQDGYSVSMPIDTALRSDVIVAYQLDGLPLIETLRLVVPGANGNVWISMITSISMSTSPLGESISANTRLTPYSPNQNLTTSTDTKEPSQQLPQTQPQPTATNNKPATTQPTPPPANSTYPPSEQQVVGQQGSVMSVEVIYILAVGLVVGLVGACFMVYRRWRLKF
jgi:hypothetical protein